MVEVSRTVRFCINASGENAADSGVFATSRNGFAAVPSMRGLGAFYELVLTCQGAPDPQTGYLINISRLDRLARQRLVPLIGTAFRSAPQTDPAALMTGLFEPFADALPNIAHALTWRLTPYYGLTIRAVDMTHVQLSQQFEFAAAHRLHVPELSPQRNRDVFGKCNNENGHGHNYRIEVTVAMPAPIGDTPPAMSLQSLEAIVLETVVDRFDHRNLNRDCPEFAELNPSVEHIARVCFDLLAPAVGEGGATLDRVRVWETEKTCCTVARGR